MTMMSPRRDICKMNHMEETIIIAIVGIVAIKQEGLLRSENVAFSSQNPKLMSWSGGLGNRGICLLQNGNISLPSSDLRQPKSKYGFKTTDTRLNGKHSYVLLVLHFFASVLLYQILKNSHECFYYYHLYKDAYAFTFPERKRRAVVEYYHRQHPVLVAQPSHHSVLITTTMCNTHFHLIIPT